MTLFFFFFNSTCNPTCYSPSGSSVHEIFQTKILDWVAIFFSRVSSWLRDRTYVFWTGRRILYHWATGKAQYDCVCVCAHTCTTSHFNCVQLFVTLWTVALQTPLSKGFSRILEWVAMPSSRASFRPKDWTCVFYISFTGRQAVYH